MKCVRLGTAIAVEIILRIILLTVPIRQGQNIDIDAAGAAPLFRTGGICFTREPYFGSVIFHKGNSHAQSIHGCLFHLYPPPVFTQ